MSHDVSCYTIIGHDVGLLDWCVTNARERAGVDHQWNVINWVNEDQSARGVEDVKQWCAKNNVHYHRFTASPKSAHPDKTNWFLENLYRGWNMGYEVAKTKWVARMGSDQFFSQDWLKNLLEAADKFGDDNVYHTWTVESDLARWSRHDVRPWGQNHAEFDVARFDNYCADMIHRYNNFLGVRGDDCGLYFRHPVKGQQRRPDGVTWLQTKKLWEELGPMSDKIEDGVTGDVSYMDSIYDKHEGFLCPRSISYHLVRGESRDIQE
jgi:hypothetical protein